MKLAWGGEEMKPENSVSKKSIDKRRITTVKGLQKAEISTASSSSVQMNKHQVRRLAIWHLSSCLVTRFLRGKIIKQIHTHTHSHPHIQIHLREEQIFNYNRTLFRGLLVRLVNSSNPPVVY